MGSVISHAVQARACEPIQVSQYFLSKTDVILVSNSFAVEECLPNFTNFPKTLSNEHVIVSGRPPYPEKNNRAKVSKL